MLTWLTYPNTPGGQWLFGPLDSLHALATGFELYIESVGESGHLN